VADTDVVLTRLHGLGPMGGTDLDAVLRNLGVTTVVGIGVSLNIGMVDFAFDAVNAGYQMVMPRDAVAGLPHDYADAVLDNTLALVCTLPTTDDVLAAWNAS
jgi:nicotinamidase-related amidase